MTGKSTCKVSFIATGDELVQGQILNTNSQKMAEILYDLGFDLHHHIVVDDLEEQIQAALSFQMKHSDIIIITGGLGPTSDDRTRFAVAKTLNKELHFSEDAYSIILKRLAKSNITADDSNRQQALFPENSIILDNPNGTAAGCQIEYDKNTIFLLPGPPRECLPMFTAHVLPALEKYATIRHKQTLLLLGASESDIATKLDQALSELPCTTGYRAEHPYIEFKIMADDAETLDKALNLVTPIVEKYKVSDSVETASAQLQRQLANNTLSLHFSEGDMAQYIRFTLLNAETKSALKDSNNCYKVTLEGLDNYWQQNGQQTSSITISISSVQNSVTTEHTIRYRDHRVLNYLLELTSHKILQFHEQYRNSN